MKKLLGILFVTALVLLVALPVLATPANNNGNNGNGNNGTVLKGTGSAFDYKGWDPIIDLSSGAANVTYWHFVDSGTNANSKPAATNMQLNFMDANGVVVYVYQWINGIFSLNGGGKNAGWVVKTPSNWVSVSGSVNEVLNQFNLSGKVTVMGPNTNPNPSPSVKEYITPMFTGDTEDYYVNNDYDLQDVWLGTWNMTGRLEEMSWDFEKYGTPAAVWYKNVEHSAGDLKYFEFNYTIEGDTITGGSNFIIAADNGFVMVVNGVVVANSNQIAGTLRDINGDYVDVDIDEGGNEVVKINYDGFAALRDGLVAPRQLYFENDWTNEWHTVYTVDWTVLEELFVVGDNNSIEIIAYNAPDDGIIIVTDGNPASVMFAGVVYSESRK
jgi:hypothetical protein